MKQDNNLTRSGPVFLALLSALLFGAATPISKRLLADLSAYHLAGLLYLGAALGVLAFLRREGGFRSPARMDRRNRLYLLGSVVFGGVLGPLALLAGLRLASAASTALWLNLEIVFTALLGHLFFRDLMTPRAWLAAAGVLAGSVLLAAGEGAAGAAAGALVALACLCWALDNHLTALIDHITPAQSTFWKGSAAGVTNLLIGAVLSGGFLPASAPVLLAALAVGAFSYGLSIMLYITAAQRLGATRSQLIFSSAPFWGVLLAVLLLGEPLRPAQAGALLLVAGSILLLAQDKHGHSHEHTPQAHTHEHDHTCPHHQHHVEPPPGVHTHEHEHRTLAHNHPHMPDLHHRHDHD